MIHDCKTKTCQSLTDFKKLLGYVPGFTQIYFGEQVPLKVIPPTPEIKCAK
jgi:hypothetical protein